jgi:AraC-like DNA-binding protein
MQAAVAQLHVHEQDCDMPLVSIPRPEVSLVVRFGISARDGLDVHAVGARRRVHRKVIRKGQRTVTARLGIDTQEAVLGVPAAEIAERIVPLEELWGDAATKLLLERLAHAQSTLDAASIIEHAIADRIASSQSRSHSHLAFHAAERLTSANVTQVAGDLGMSQRHLRRIFRDAIGISPKAFSKLARFHRAVRAARRERPSSWASIAVESGYYDQAHLIAEFRAITGVTPRAFLAELDLGRSPAPPR